MLRVFVYLFLILWFVVLNIMDFVDLYEGAKKMFPEVVGGKYEGLRIRELSLNATLNSSPLLMGITILMYPSCGLGGVCFVEVCYLMIYILLYFVIKAKREENSKKAARKTKCLNDTDYVVMNVVKGNSEMKVAEKEIYDVILKDTNGEIVTIKTIDSRYYEEKMLTGEKVKISKKDIEFVYEQKDK